MVIIASGVHPVPAICCNKFGGLGMRALRLGAIGSTEDDSAPQSGEESARLTDWTGLKQLQAAIA